MTRASALNPFSGCCRQSDPAGSGRYEAEWPFVSVRPSTGRPPVGPNLFRSGHTRPAVVVTRYISLRFAVQPACTAAPSGVSAEGVPQRSYRREPPSSDFCPAAKRRDRQRRDFSPLLRTRPSDLCFVGLKFFVRCGRECLATLGRCSSTDRVSLSARASLLPPRGAPACDRCRITCGG